MGDTDKKFLEEAQFLEKPPSGFDPTMELKWIDARDSKTAFALHQSDNASFAPYVLCQKYRGAFRDVWVRVPISD